MDEAVKAIDRLENKIRGTIRLNTLLHAAAMLDRNTSSRQDRVTQRAPAGKALGSVT